MKIIFDNIVYSLQKAGGISVVWQELTSRFINNEKDELVFIEHKTDSQNIFRQLLDIPNHCIKVVHPLFFTIERYLSPHIKQDKPFIFHSSYFRTCSNKNAINVSTIHDFTYDYFYKGKRRGAFLHIKQRNRAIEKSDAIVCISENTRRDLLKFIPRVNPKKVHVIYNGVSSDYKVLPTSEGKDELRNCLLFVGERVAYKNGKFFVDAIKDTDYKVVFCGKPLLESERDYLDKTLGKNRYLSFSNLSNKELNVIYNSVKCLVYPSSYEGFGIPVLEAQSAGCPVVAYNSSSIPEIIGDTPLLMNELTNEEFLGKIALLNDMETRKNIIMKGLENVKRFSWDNTYRQYRELYSNLLKDRIS